MKNFWILQKEKKREEEEKVEKESFFNRTEILIYHFCYIPKSFNFLFGSKYSNPNI